MSRETITDNLGQFISGITLVLSLVGSWGYFYSEQRINTLMLNEQRAISNRQDETIQKLTINQSQLFASVSNNNTSFLELTNSVKEMARAIQENQLYIAKIVNKNRLE